MASPQVEKKSGNNTTGIFTTLWKSNSEECKFNNETYNEAWGGEREIIYLRWLGG